LRTLLLRFNFLNIIQTFYGLKVKLIKTLANVNQVLDKTYLAKREQIHCYSYSNNNNNNNNHSNYNNNTSYTA